MDAPLSEAKRSAGAEDNAGVVAQPPYIFLGFLALGFGLDTAWPFGLGLAGAEVPGGIAMVALGLAIATLALRQFAKAGTSYQTRDPARALIACGLYRHSRNPAYIGLIVVYAGVGVAVDNPWILGLAVPAVALVRIAVIAREERYLEAKFGAEYRRYRSVVRRWL